MCRASGINIFEHVDLLFEFVLVPLFLKGPRIPVPDVLCDLEELTKIVCEEYGGLGGIQFLNALEGEGSNVTFPSHLQNFSYPTEIMRNRLFQF